jgi:hypothetical protein
VLGRQEAQVLLPSARRLQVVDLLSCYKLNLVSRKPKPDFDLQGEAIADSSDSSAETRATGTIQDHSEVNR